MSTATSLTDSVSRGDLRDVHRFVFEDLSWGFRISPKLPLHVDIYGDPEFGRLRSLGPFSDPVDAVCEALIQAIVALAGRATPLTLGLSSATIESPEALKLARRRLRNHISSATWRAMEEAGVDGWRELIHRGRPKAEIILNATPESDRRSKPNPVDAVAELCRESDTDDLLKASKYVLNSPLDLEIELGDDDPVLRLKSRSGRGDPYLAGLRTSDRADKARSAIAVASATLVGGLTIADFDALIPTSFGPQAVRLKVLRTRVVQEITRAIDPGGADGLVELCKRGLMPA